MFHPLTGDLIRPWRGRGRGTRGGPVRASRLFGLSLAVLTLSACAAAPGPSFDPVGPCTVDGRTAGAYPALERRVPPTLGGRAPDTLDSGRNCTPQNLGTLAGHGITEVRFGGGIWGGDGSRGITLAVFQAPGLTAAWLGEWYEATARAARHTTSFDPSGMLISGRQAYRLDVTNGDKVQTVIVWPSPDGDLVQVVLASDETDEAISAAVAAFP
jgi:hypothetical protein